MHTWLKVSVFKTGRNLSRYKEVVIEGVGGGRHLNKMNLMKYSFKQQIFVKTKNKNNDGEFENLLQGGRYQ